MRKFRVKLLNDNSPSNVPETLIVSNDIPDILIKEGTYPVYWIKNGHVEFDQQANLNSSYKNYIHHYKRATTGTL